MSARTYLCLDLGDRQLRAVSVAVDGQIATVERALLTDVPSELCAPGDAGDIDAIGRWIAETLRRAAFALGTGVETIITLDREQAAIRRVDLPTDDPDELADMARLAMLRETPVEAGVLAVDLVPREIKGSVTTVLMAAAPQPSIDRAKRLAEAIGRSGAIVSLRSFGTARLLHDASSEGGGGLVVGFDSSGDAFELLVLRAGEILHSRGIRTVDHAAAASEAKRSWMGYRLSQADEPLGAAVLFAPPSAQEALLKAVEAAVGKGPGRGASPASPAGETEAGRAEAGVRVFAPSNSIRIAAGVDRESLGHAWPLVGLALEHAAAEESINLAAPRKAPDFAARRRLRILSAAGVLVVAGLLGWTVGNLSRQSFAAEVETLTRLATSQLPDFHRFKRDEHKLSHLRAWESASPEWLEEARRIHGFAPDASKVVFDSFNGTLEASDVRFDRDQSWKLSADLKIAISGEAKDRATADAFRDVLVDDGRYAVTSSGADTEGGRRLASPFLYVLRATADRADQPVKREEAPK
jgi:hypothetical protein